MTNNQQPLYQQFDTASNMGFLNKQIPSHICDNLNPKFQLRPYQEEAFARFFYYLNGYNCKKTPTHLLFNMATGSGKTIIMAGLILYLYEKGHRNFLFFVNTTNIIEKTKDNFPNWNVDFRKQDLAFAEWQKLDLKKQKHALIELLNKNQLYVNLSEIEDKNMKCTDEEKKLSKGFYSNKGIKNGKKN